MLSKPGLITLDPVSVVSLAAKELELEVNQERTEEMEEGEQVSSKKFGRDSDDETEGGVRQWVKCEKIQQSSDGDENKVRGDEPNNASRDAGQPRDMKSTPPVHGLVYSLTDLCSNAHLPQGPMLYSLFCVSLIDLQ